MTNKKEAVSLRCINKSLLKLKTVDYNSYRYYLRILPNITPDKYQSLLDKINKKLSEAKEVKNHITARKKIEIFDSGSYGDIVEITFSDGRTIRFKKRCGSVFQTKEVHEKQQKFFDKESVKLTGVNYCSSVAWRFNKDFKDGFNRLRLILKDVKQLLKENNIRVITAIHLDRDKDRGYNLHFHIISDKDLNPFKDEIKEIIEKYDTIQFRDKYFHGSIADDITGITFLKYMVFHTNLKGLNLKDNYKEMLLIEECLVRARLYTSNYEYKVEIEKLYKVDPITKKLNMDLVYLVNLPKKINIKDEYYIPALPQYINNNTSTEVSSVLQQPSGML